MDFSPLIPIRQRPGAASRIIAGEVVILDLESGLYFGLDPVGTRVWELVAEKGTFGAILQAMLEEFDVEEERLRADLELLLEELLAAGLIRVGDTAG